eukprot:TRINITY_DN1378_c0_g1_i3.p1 TRINITY_DN1378_c0_g1~~TRINITY_DN1378_c0_g1_i3.p1  ORF type:complete len:348 (+),score=25.17 TRINITY_DN1378_c0_g1_i3:99-1046(+)
MLWKKKKKVEEEQKEASKFTYYFSSTGNILYTLNIISSKGQKITFDYNAPSETATIIVADCFYLVGGDLKHKPVGATYSVKLVTDDFSSAVKKADLNVPRCGIGLESYQSAYIYAVGGCVFTTKWKSLAECERYDIAKDEWNKLPSLNERKAYVCACRMDDTIYAIGGYMYPSGCRLTKLEKLSLVDEQKGWEIIEVDDPDKVWVPRRGCGGIEIGSNKVLIFGGISKPADFTMTYILHNSGDKYTIKAAGCKVQGKGVHWNHQKNIVKASDKVYAISYDSTVHIYDITQNQWKALSKLQWKPEQLLKKVRVIIQ